MGHSPSERRTENTDFTSLYTTIKHTSFVSTSPI